jgi:hypothetical protein
MAWIRRRTRSDGRVSVAVQWRDARGRLQSETFREEVDGRGGDWPSRWVKGQGFPACQRT